MRNIALEKSTGECLHDFELGRDFLSSIQNALNPVGKKKDKSDYIKKFYSSKNPIKRKKRQATEWEETLKYRYLIKKKKNIFPEYIQNSCKSWNQRNGQKA